LSVTTVTEFDSDYSSKGNCPLPTVDENSYDGQRSMLVAMPIRLPPPKQEVGQIRGVRGYLLSRNMCCVIIKITIYVRLYKGILRRCFFCGDRGGYGILMPRHYV